MKKFGRQIGISLSFQNTYYTCFHSSIFFCNIITFEDDDNGNGKDDAPSWFNWDNLCPCIEISDEDFQIHTEYLLGNNIDIENYYVIFIWNSCTMNWPADSILYRYQN
ncbi:MAG: hypothetical protein R6V04_03405 [bacterium]